MLRVAEVQPRKIRAGYEHVDHSAVHSMQNIFEQEIFVAVKHAVERGADAKQQDERCAINQRDRHLVGRLRTEQQEKRGVAGRQNPKAVSDNVGDMFNLQREVS